MAPPSHPLRSSLGIGMCTIEEKIYSKIKMSILAFRNVYFLIKFVVKCSTNCEEFEATLVYENRLLV
jgi:hypothetical protein